MEMAEYWDNQAKNTSLSQGVRDTYTVKANEYRASA